MAERMQSGKGQDWWAVTAIHEAAHGVMAYALDTWPIQLRLIRNMAYVNSPQAGYCRYGVRSDSVSSECRSIFIGNAPFTCHEYLPTGDKGDLHERHDAYHDFCGLVGVSSHALFRLYVDEPSIQFFGHDPVQEAVLTTARKLYKENSIDMKKRGHWAEFFGIPPFIINQIREACNSLLARVQEGREAARRKNEK